MSRKDNQYAREVDARKEFMKIRIPTVPMKKKLNKMSQGQLFALIMSLDNTTSAIARSSMSMKKCYSEMNKVSRKQERVRNVYARKNTRGEFKCGK